MAGQFRFDGDAQVGDIVTINGAEAHHAIKVRRVKIGEQLNLTNGVTHSFTGEVVEAADYLSVRILTRVQIVAHKLSFVLVQALAKGDRDELAIQAASEIGVSRVMPWQANRSVSRWEGSKVEKQVTRWQAICDEACKQSLQPLFTSVEQPVTSRQISEQIKQSSGLWLILDPTASASIVDLVLPEEGEIFLLVGPEGGISHEEIESFEQNGAKGVRLGASVLRTSTGGVAALSVLSARAGLWSK